MTLQDCIERLERFYGLLPTPPPDPFQLFVWEVLSHQAIPAKRDAAFAALKKAHTLTPDAVRRAPASVLEPAVKVIGPYFEQRLEALRAGADVFRRLPELSHALARGLHTARRALQPLPHLGDGAAHRMLLFAGDYLVLPVDARAHRVARRLGYGAADSRVRKTARSVRRALTRELPCDVEAYRRTFLYLSHHGALTCTEADPHCTVCPLLADCPEGSVRVKAEI